MFTWQSSGAEQDNLSDIYQTALAPSVIGTEGNDQFHGGVTKDLIYGHLGDDILFGRRGHDVLSGENGNDSLWGGSGRDTLMGGSGDDDLHGGGGTDLAVFEGDIDTRVRLDRTWKQNTGHGKDRFTSIENVITSDGDDTIVGNYTANWISSGSGNDTLRGKGGHDKLLGGEGADLISGGTGNDYISGGRGDDVLRGDSGDDTILAGRGDDVIEGLDGSDVLTGGAGRDTFVFNLGDGADTITDFEVGIDHIQIGRGASRFGQLDFEQVGDDVIVSFRNVEITVEDMTVSEIADSENFLFV